MFWIFFNSRFLLDEKEYDDNMRDLFPDSVYSLPYFLDAVFWISFNSRWNCKFLIRCEGIFMIDLFPDSVFSLNYFLVCTSHQQHWLHLTLTCCKYIFFQSCRPAQSHHSLMESLVTTLNQTLHAFPRRQSWTMIFQVTPSQGNAILKNLKFKKNSC